MKQIHSTFLGLVVLAAAWPALLPVDVAHAAPQITATKRDQLSVDNNGNGLASPGETLRYTVVVTNSGTTAGTNVMFSDLLDPHLTLVPGSVQTTPLARHDAYSTVGNVLLTVPAATGVLINDSDPDGTGGLAVSAFSPTSANGGNVSVAADGSFTYNPAPGFSGTDTFTYTINDGEGNTDSATVTISVGQVVWFINNAVGGPGDGRFTSPFNTIANFNALAADEPGDYIFVYQGSGAYSGAFTLLNNEQLIGHGVGLSISPNLAIAAAPRPTIANVALAANNTVRGLNLNTSSGTSLSGANVGTLTVNGASVTNTAGTAINLANGNVSVLLDSVAASGGANGIRLSHCGGSFTVTGDGASTQNGTGGTIQNTTDNGVHLDSVTNVFLARMRINNCADNGIFGQNLHGFVLDWCSLINNGDATDEGGLRLGDPIAAVNGLTGSGPAGANPTRIANTLFRASGENNISIFNNGGTLTQLDVTNVVSKDTRTRPLGADGFYFEPRGNASATLNFTSCSFSNNFTQGIQALALAQSVLTVNVVDCGFTNNNEGVLVENANDADLTFDLGPNRFFNNLASGAAGAALTAVNATTVTTAAILSGKIRNNTIIGGVDNHLITVLFSGVANSNTVQVANNTINAANAEFSGIFVQAGETGSGAVSANVTVTDNVVSVGALGSHGIALQSRTNATLCAEINGNVSTTGGVGLFGINVRQRDVSTFRLPGFLGPFNSAPAVVTFLSGKNPGSTVGATVATAYSGGAACTLPLLAMPCPDSFQFPSAGRNSDSFPLTPALSPGERETIISLPDHSTRFDLAETLEAILPLPGGEGRAFAAPELRPCRRGEGDRGSGTPVMVNAVSAAPVNLTDETLKPILAAARQRWSDVGLTREQLAVLDSLHFEVTDLAGWYLGASSGRLVQLDRRATGYGWFIDPTPGADEEFPLGTSETRRQTRGALAHETPATDTHRRIDLLSAVLHEMGHQLGLADDYRPAARDDVMYGFLTPGERRLPVCDQARGVPVSGPDARIHYMFTPVDLGLFSPGKSITITFDVTVASDISVCTVTNQGSVTGANFSPVVTDDPDTGAANDPTITPIFIAPMIGCPADVLTNNAAGQCQQTVAFLTPASGCPPPNVICRIGMTVIMSPYAFPVGTNAVTCTATNVAGTNACGFTVIVLDMQPPSITCTNITVSTDTNQCDAVVNFAPVFGDNCPGVGTPVCTPSSGSAFAKGPTSVSCLVLDAAGNSNSCSFTITVNDTRKPAISCPADLLATNTPGQCWATVSYVTPGATDNCPGVGVVACYPSSGTNFAVGTNFVTCTVVDASNNTNACSFRVVVLDLELPMIHCPTNLSLIAGTNLCVVTNYTVSATDNCGVVSTNCSPPSGFCFPVGTNTVMCTAVDVHNNTNTCSFTIVVISCDITCSTNIVVPRETSDCGATVTYAASTIIGDCGPVMCAPPSGSFFPAGTNVVSCTSANGGGCSFTVAVLHTDPPMITCPGNSVFDADMGQCSKSNVTFAVSAVDDCGTNLTVICTATNGATFPVGTNMVNCVAIDSTGNSVSCSFKVTVFDTQAPGMGCPLDKVLAADSGQCSRSNVTWTLTATDNCAIASSNCVPPSGTTFPVGTNTVTCTAIDVNGNTNACSFTVAVFDDQRPTISCSNLLIVAPPGATSVATNFSVTVSDNCPGVSTNCVPPPGTAFPLGLTPVQCVVTDASGNTNVCSFTITVCSPLVTVVNTNDSGVGSLRWAIANVCVNGTITFAPALNGQTIVLTSGELFINKSLSITGPGANQLAVSGNNTSRVLKIVADGIVVNLSGLTVADGRNEAFGGGIATQALGASLNITGLTITNCAAPQGGGLYWENGTLHLLNSTITGNSALEGGGLLLQDISATLSNCTLSANVATMNASAIFHFSGYTNSMLTLVHCTVTENVGGAGGIWTFSRVLDIATTRLLNTLASSNTTSGINHNFNTSGTAGLASLVSLGHNLDSDGSSGFTDGVNGDQVGTLANLIDPKLGPLANNGGPTLTHALLPGSPAINAGTNAGAAGLAFDQRGPGFPRIFDVIVDIGAFEVNCTPVTSTLTATTNGSCTLPDLAYQNTNPVCIVQAPGGSNSFFITDATNVPLGFAVTNGSYRGWCVEYSGRIEYGVQQKPRIYAAHGDLPLSLQHSNWGRVNYLLNHKQGTAVDVQAAIWHFIGGPVPTSDHVYYPPSATASNMIAAAETNGTFTPGLGDVAAVILDATPAYQLAIIEVHCPADLFRLCANPSGTEPFAYQWCKNGMAIPNATNSCLSVTNRTVADAGEYCVKVSNACGLVTNCTTIVGQTVFIVTSASPPGGGTTTGDGAFAASSMVTVMATPAPGFLFVNWTEGGAEVSTLASYTFVANADRSLVANFALTFSNCVARWKLDETNGLTAFDSSGTNHGRLTNGVAFTTMGRVNGAVALDGVNDQVVVLSSPSVQFTNPAFTLALWVKTTRMVSQALVEKQHSGFGGMFLLALNRDNAVPGGFSVWTGSAWIDSNWRGATNGQFHHLAVTFDGTTFRLWRDGVLDRAVNAPAGYLPTSGPLNFGRFGTGNVGWFFGGVLDDIIKCDRAFSAAEIAVLAGVQQAATLTVLSANPNAGVTIGVTPADSTGATNGLTTFTRSYLSNVVVTVTAPATAGGNTFAAWQQGGTNYSTNLTTVVTMDTSHTLTALYVAPVAPITRALTVASINPTGGVAIVVSPNDTNGLGNDTTRFSRVYSNGTTVTLTAPSVLGGTNTFLRWQRNGADWSTSTNTSVTLDADYTMTAVYQAPGPALRTLTVASVNPDSGVMIGVSPADNNGQAGGNTLFTRSYTNTPLVTLTAPASAGSNIFRGWQSNGVDMTTNLVVVAHLDGNQLWTAVFGGGDDPVGWWKFDDGSGNTAQDSSGNGNHGALKNGPLFTADGRIAGALNFDGVNDFVTTPDSDLLEFAGRNFTVALWVRTTKAGPQALVEKQHTGVGGFFLLALNRDNAVPGGFSVWHGSDWIDSNFRGVTDGQWHHLAVVYGDGVFHLYRDGVLDRSVNKVATYQNTTFGLNFGRFGTANIGWPFGGSMDDLRRYNRGLSGTEISTLAKASPPVRALNVASLNPASGVAIAVSPNDTNGLANGVTAFPRYYTNGTTATLTAPASFDGNAFVKWQRDGVDATNGLTVLVLMDGDHTLTAVYQTTAPPGRRLDVASVNPDSGVVIAVSVADTNGLTAGTTAFARNYSNTVTVTLTAPATAGGNAFAKWQLDGVDATTNLALMVSMSTGHTAIAFYGGADLVGWWKLDEASGAIASDSSGFGHTGFLTNGPFFFTNSVCGNGVSFDGINDLIRINDSDLLDFNGRSFTVALRIQTSKAGSQALVEKQHSSFSGFFLFALNRDNVAPGKVSVWTGSDWIDSTGAGLTDGAWHQVAVTFDGITFRLYRDGLLDKAQVAPANYVNTTLPLNLGRFVTGNIGWPYQGALDEVRRYNRALSAPEVAALTNCPAMLPPPLPFSDPNSTLTAPRSLRIQRTADGSVLISGDGVPDRLYWLDASSDLEAWTILTGVEANRHGRFILIDKTAASHPARFYRVFVQ